MALHVRTEEGFAPPKEFEHRRTESLALHQESQAIAAAAFRVGSVCRVVDRGSAVLISKVCRGDRSAVPSTLKPVAPAVGVLLTTPAVLPDAESAHGVTAVFNESLGVVARKVHGNTLRKNTPKRCEVRLLPSMLYYCSVPRDQQRPARVLAGYVLVACELYGINGATLTHAVPLKLPLLRNVGAPFEEGDGCLVVQHPNGTDSLKYHITRALKVHTHHTQLSVPTPPDYSSSGGPVFTESGEFVGLSHMEGDVHICIHLGDVVQHMMASCILGHIEVSILPEDSTLSDKFTIDGLPIEEDEEEDEVVYKHSWKDLWNSWYNPTQYQTIIHLLYAFPYCTPLVEKALLELISHSQRLNISKLSELSGVPVVLKVLQEHIDNSDVCSAAVSVLGRASDTPANCLAIAKGGGLPIAVEVMDQYHHNPRMVGWCTFLLSAMLSHEDIQGDSREAFASGGGAQLVDNALRSYPDDKYLVKWGCRCFASFVANSDDYLVKVLSVGLPRLLVDLLERYHNYDDCSVAGAITETLLACIEESSLPEVEEVILQLTKVGVMQLLAKTITVWTIQREEAVLESASGCVFHFISTYEGAREEALLLNIDQLLYEATQACPSSVKVLSVAVKTVAKLGVDVKTKFDGNDLLSDVEWGMV